MGASLAPDRRADLREGGNVKIYALSAYILHLNDIVDADAVLDTETMREIRMPNRDGFVSDPRPEAHQ